MKARIFAGSILCALILLGAPQSANADDKELEEELEEPIVNVVACKILLSMKERGVPVPRAAIERVCDGSPPKLIRE